ncbi:MAG TPA: TM2 domain-containing protein [Thioalkalivibrio sp.]|nr:TM2 domain-containing protein [Thioalkalivibrio sp.]
MSQAWKKLDLGGAGLQTVNARITSQMRRHRVAYPLAALFPLGAHRFYLGTPLAGGAYLALTAATVGLWLFGTAWAALIPAGLALAFLVFDLFWMDRYIVRFNKELRMAQFMQPDARPPKNFQGRYTDETDLEGYLKEKEQERAGHQPVDFEALSEFGQKQHIPSFNEQEAMLRELARHRKDGKSEEK